MVCFLLGKKSRNFSFEDNGLRDTGLSDLPIEVLHSLLIQIHPYVSNESTIEHFEQLLDLLRKGF